MTSASILVTPGAAAQLVIIRQPSGGSSAVAFTTQPIIQVRDAAGNNVAVVLSVTVTILSNTGPPGMTVSAGSPVSSIVTNGTATFATLTVTGTGTFTLLFSAPAVTGAASASVIY